MMSFLPALTGAAFQAIKALRADVSKVNRGGRLLVVVLRQGRYAARW
jgi:hypothetical protein